MMQKAANKVPYDGMSARTSFNLGSFLNKQENNWKYFTYSGSLTTPHCNEVVTWVVHSEPILVQKKDVSSYINRIHHM